MLPPRKWLEKALGKTEEIHNKTTNPLLHIALKLDTYNIHNEIGYYEITVCILYNNKARAFELVTRDYAGKILWIDLMGLKVALAN